MPWLRRTVVVVVVEIFDGSRCLIDEADAR
jgi:hypothetical protein